LKKFIEADAHNYRRSVTSFISVAGLMMELTELAQKGSGKLSRLNEFVNSYDCLILDDLGAEKLTEATRQNLYYIIDERYKNMGKMIITSNFTIDQINEIEPRIASRLAEMGDIIKLNFEDYRLKKI
jgi:DNA replication protein DnaC